jgi:hypothetical protein
VRLPLRALANSCRRYGWTLGRSILKSRFASGGGSDDLTVIRRWGVVYGSSNLRPVRDGLRILRVILREKFGAKWLVVDDQFQGTADAFP